MIKHNQSEGQNSPDHSQPEQSFAKEIEKVEMQRINLMRIIFRQKQEVKQNYQYYLNKKSIVPSSLNCLNSSSIEPNTFHLNLRRKLQSAQVIDLHVPPSKETADNREIPTAEQMKQRKSPKRLSDETQIQKWRLEMTSEQKNCFVYGKELKIGSKLRKMLIGDDDINKLKKTVLFRSKKKPKSVYNKDLLCSNNNNLQKSKWNLNQMKLALPRSILSFQHCSNHQRSVEQIKTEGTEKKKIRIERGEKQKSGYLGPALLQGERMLKCLTSGAKNRLV